LSDGLTMVEQLSTIVELSLNYRSHNFLCPKFATFAVMKKLLLVLFLGFLAGSVSAQKVDSIFFNLYTDSLKKCQHNYINIDGKLSDGTWKPMTSAEIVFSSADAKFEGNELVIPCDFKAEKVTIKACLKNNPSISLQRTIWVKKKPDPDKLPTNEEILRDSTRTKANKPKKNN
jgi:hypothetical protein